MFRNTQGKILVGVMILTLVTVGVVIVMGKSVPAAAQVPPGMGEGAMPPPPQGPGAQPGMPGQPGQMNPQGGWNMPQPGFRPIPGVSMMGGTPAIAASGDYVYVVQGNTLYQVHAKTLKLVNKLQLVPDQSRRVYPMEGQEAPQ